MADPDRLPQMHRLLQIMARLRDPLEGCEWDAAQNFETIAPYTIEEAYEVADAIERKDMDDLRSELGDLLLQVAFHSQMASEADLFDFEDVASSISEKMASRHPHIFAEAGGPMTNKRWEDIKAKEREEKTGHTSALDGVAKALPALMRSDKLQKRAARVGFEWQDLRGPKAKLDEEIDELEAASEEERLMEAGDVLFVAVNIIRRFGVDPEEALRASNNKFEKRFAAMEAMARKNGEDFAELSLDQQESYWQKVKAEENSARS